MAIPKVCGIETEYGIVVRGAENNPVSASSLLINAYVAATTSRAARPGRLGLRRRAPGERRPRLLARRRHRPRGRDHARQRRADQRRPLLRRPRPPGDLAPRGRRRPRGRALGPGRRGDRPPQHGPRRRPSWRRRPTAPAEVIVHKNNSDGKGNSYGCHENYLLARETPFGRIVAQVTPHFVTRQVFTGAGKVGCELPGVPNDHVPYQLSQRADFFEEEVGLETTLKRPIVNTRDEPHCDAQKYRRLHVIVGDANMSEVATYLKVGTTAIVLAMIEDDALGDDWLLGNPVVGDPPGQPRPDADAHDHAARRPPGDGAGDPVGAARAGPQVRAAARAGVRRRGASASTCCAAGSRSSPGSSTTPTSVAHWVDWVAKRRLVDGLRRPPRHRARVAAAEGDRPAVPRPAPGQGPRRRGPGWRRSSTRPTSTRRSPSRRRAPGPTSVAAASPSTPTRSWPRTGTRSCSTSAASRCGGSR